MNGDHQVFWLKVSLYLKLCFQLFVKAEEIITACLHLNKLLPKKNNAFFLKFQPKAEYLSCVRTIKKMNMR